MNKRARQQRERRAARAKASGISSPKPPIRIHCSQCGTALQHAAEPCPRCEPNGVPLCPCHGLPMQPAVTRAGSSRLLGVMIGHGDDVIEEFGPFVGSRRTG